MSVTLYFFVHHPLTFQSQLRLRARDSLLPRSDSFSLSTGIHCTADHYSLSLPPEAFDAVGRWIESKFIDSYEAVAFVQGFRGIGCFEVAFETRGVCFGENVFEEHGAGTVVLIAGFGGDHADVFGI